MGTQTILQSENQDRIIAKLTILSDIKLIKTVVSTVSNVADTLGLSDDDIIKLGDVLSEIFKNIVCEGYGGDNKQEINVSISIREHSLVVTIEDKGLPFYFDKLKEQSDNRFNSILALNYADQVNYKNLGSNGNRAEIVKYLPVTDIRKTLDISVHKNHIEKEKADSSENIRIQMLELKDIKELVKVVYRNYGYTYPNEFMYHPERIEAKIKSNLMKSCVAYNSRNEIVGHLSLSFETNESKVGESGVAIVDTRYRGHGIFKNMRNYLYRYALENEIVGIYGEAVTIHPYTQKGVLKLGGKEAGFLLGYSPDNVSVKDIREDGQNRRQSIVLMYTAVTPNEKKTVYLPDVYHEYAYNLYEYLGFQRDIVLSDTSIKKSDTKLGKTNVVVRHDHNQAFIIVEEYGRDTLVEINFLVREMCMNKIDCIYLDLPIFEQLSSYVIPKLRDSGFFFGGILPELRNGDVLRLQYLNNVEIMKNDIKTASDFGSKLLNYVIEDMEQVEMNSLLSAS